MKIKEGIETLDLTRDVQGNPTPIYPTLIWDNEDVILIDTSIPGQLPAIKEAMDKAGVPFSKLTRVILTHQDWDHFGSLPQILKEANHRIEVLAHSADKPYVEGDKQLIKMSPERLTSILATFPPEERQQAEELYILRAKIDKPLEDGQVLPYCGGINVIHTPGHTPGHVCLYHNQSKILIAGDALNITDGKLSGPKPEFTPDLKLAVNSIKKLLEYDIEAIICFHGGVFTKDINKSLLELINIYEL